MISKLVLIAGLFVGILVVISFVPPAKLVVQWGRTKFDLRHVYREGSAAMEVTLFLESTYFPPAAQPDADKATVTVRGDVLSIELLPVQVVKKRFDLHGAVSGMPYREMFTFSQPLVVDGKLYPTVVISQAGREVTYHLEAIPETALVRVKSAEGDIANYWPKVEDQDVRYGSPKYTAGVTYFPKDPMLSNGRQAISLSEDNALTKAELLKKVPELPATTLTTWEVFGKASN